ncbi:MAG: hypothetical protein A2X82_09035 [Geobacteraceae bacterium GWC2_55_20]|nr:MAG: hypothetical protein A2X82_09035 [Geobacteraceae bacterium GWC2_55_20]
MNNITTNTLDKLGRIKQISDPLNNLTNLNYDKVGRITTRTDANGNLTAYSYDALGRIKSQTDAEGGITSFTYDKRGNLTSLTDPENNTTTFEYDKAGRKTKETRPEGQATSYAYYPNGLLKTVTDAKSQTTTYTYDKANRLTETKFADNTKHTFQYDKNGNLTSYATPDVTATISYDTANRKTSETVTIGAITKIYSYSYDTKGNKQTFTSPEGITYSYTYNKNDQPKTITTPAGQIALDYTWVRNSKVTLPNGVVTDYSFNVNSWLTGIAAQKTPNTVFTANYQFDKVGNITQKTNDVTSNYGYDKTYQLTNSTNSQNSETFTYDKVGNRKTKQGTQAPWTYNKNNELINAEIAIYGYDSNGNTTTKIEGSSTTSFSYNSTDRLTSVQLPDGRAATYTYDPFGRRIKKQIGLEATILVYADEGLIGEYTTQGTATKTYGWRPNGIWGTNPVFQQENGQYYFYHNDHLGTPQKLTDAAGDIVWEATYEAFGKANVDPDSTIVNNLRFPGQYFDEESNLHYNWNRYYDPRTGRYTQNDTIGFYGGEVNLYRYADNQVLTNLDPWGLVTITLLPPSSGNNVVTSGKQSPRFGKPISTLSFPKYKCREYESTCLKNCLLDFLINKGIDKLTFGFNPTELDVNRKQNGLEWSESGIAGAGIKTAETLTSNDLDRLEKEYAKYDELSNRPRSDNRASTTQKYISKKNSIMKKLKLLRAMPIIYIVYDTAKSGYDFNKCFDDCEKK